MQPIFAEARSLLEKNEPFVLASVVRTKGSTPQKPGAKLLVRRDGTFNGTLGGGCVEAEVWAEARSILEAATSGEVSQPATPQLRHFELNEEIAAQDGLVCGGTMEILIEPLVSEPRLIPLFDEILEAYEGRGDRALATCVRTGASSDPSSRLFVRADGTRVGSLGDAPLDDLAASAALEQMPRGREQWLEVPEAAEGQTTQIYVEAFTHPATLVIAGGGHVGKALYSLACFLGFRTIIVDDRSQFANKERFPEADRIIVDAFDRGLREIGMGPNHFVVVATRGHKLDDVALLEAARSNASYVGLLGSKRKAVLIFRSLYQAGVSESRVRQIRAPVGLDIGGRQPEEIAVSILAEIVAVRNERTGGSMTVDDNVVSKVKKIAGRDIVETRLQGRE